MMRKHSLILALLFFTTISFSQTIKLTGYCFETGNRGYLNMVQIRVENRAGVEIAKSASNLEGSFDLDLPINEEFVITATKDLFEVKEERVSTIGRNEGDKLYLKIQMKRKPGYVFDVTLAEKRVGNNVTDAISGARIEVYNNMTEKEELVLENHPNPTFKCNFENGNHYTIMVRKKGFFTKRMEAYVNVKGCILCFDGVGEVKPGVSDVLTEGHEMGTLLANVELIPIKLNKGIKIENIYYDLNKYRIRKDAALELDKLVGILKDNPSLLVELGSHTDARGDDKYNKRLSRKRAEAAVAYITKKGGINTDRITAKGYGETQLVNKCKNGVKCDESKHEVNRRTELKIIGVAQIDPYADKSLAQIIKGESFEKMLAEVQNQEVIKIAPGESLPDEIAKQVAGESEAPPSEPMNANISTEPMKQSEPSVVTVVTQSAPVTTVEDKPAYIQPSEPLIKKPKKRTDVTSAESEDFSGEMDNKSSRRIVSGFEVSSRTEPSVPKAMPYNYTGFMVEFFASSFELPSSHEVFARHGKIFIEQKKDGTYAYLFGPFESWRDANKFLQSLADSKYRTAEVVRYRKGNRLNRK